MIPKDLTRDIISDLKTIKGQIEGVIKMLGNESAPEQIVNQFKAIDKAFQKTQFLLLDEVYRKALAISIVDAVRACPGNCGNEDKIEYIRQEFPKLKLNELSSKLQEIAEIQQRIEKYNKEG
ncbi:metal-sensing transcriptional repressor [Sunxiuqinia indica]|uniref:metal-sensing transcriptional repressor n=1 Tax=Sunxiuqinia indica TaxID=2692584 RepID=UPI001357D049|nr:metal-sensing transcriptional repressor [Sunxiuqinia indica]